MAEDARFADGAPTRGPLRLRAEDERDLAVVSALIQDAVVSAADISWDARRRRLALLLHRFRWEDAADAETERRGYERVRSVLVVSDVTALRADGIEQGDRDVVLSLLALRWSPGPDGTGTLTLVFAGDGALAAEAECLSVELGDVTQPWRAHSARRPAHDG